MLTLILIFAFLIWFTHHEITSSRPSDSFAVSRSQPKTYPPDRVECGNCRGTGLDGFGIMPDSFTCGACDGKGSFKIDPNAKVYTWSEWVEKYGKDK